MKAIWTASHLRLTTFGGSDPPAEPWRLVTGEDPETIAVDNRAGKTEHSGIFRDAALGFTHTKVARRIDWRVSAAVKDDSHESQALPTIGVAEALDVLGHVAGTWLKAQEHAPVRLALGGILVSPVEGHEEGYLKLAGFLPSLNLDPKSRDLFYQINRPRQSRVAPDLRINRISKWAVEMTSFAEVSLGGTGFSMPPLQTLAYRARLELDINTDAGRIESLPSPLDLWSELVELGREIADKGDVP